MEAAAGESEFENQLSSETMKDRRESKKSKSEEESRHKPQDQKVVAPPWRDSLSSLSSNSRRRSVEDGGGVMNNIATKSEEENSSSSSGRERLKRHRVEVAGRVWIPEMWGQEDFLKEWIDCTVFDAALRNSGIRSARASLVEEGRRSNSATFRIENSC